MKIQQELFNPSGFNHGNTPQNVHALLLTERGYSVGSLKYHLKKAKLNNEEKAHFSAPYSIIIVPNILKQFYFITNS